MPNKVTRFPCPFVTNPANHGPRVHARCIICRGVGSVKAPMSARLYVTMAGRYCPCCGSTQMNGGSIDLGGGQASQSISCLRCDARWTDVYVLSNMCDLQPSEGKEETR